MRKFKKGETYHVTSSCGSWAIFRPHTTQSEKELTIDGHFSIKADVISNMNKHWSKEKFFRPDGVCTYPFGKGNAISVNGRETRIANEREKSLLDFSIKIGYAPTEAEFRAERINILLD